MMGMDGMGGGIAAARNYFRRKPEAPADIEVAHRASWLTAVAIFGRSDRVASVARALEQPRALSWRPSEDVEREAVIRALQTTGRKIQDLSFEDLASAAEYVEARHEIQDGSVGRFFRHLFKGSNAQARNYMRTLIATPPAASARADRQSGQVAVSLLGITAPPFRVVRGSYRYAGRAWCKQNWGCPEDVATLESRNALFDFDRARIYLLESVESHPLPAFARLAEQHRDLSVGLAASDGTSGTIMTLGLGTSGPASGSAPTAASTQSDRRRELCDKALELARSAQLATYKTPPTHLPTTASQTAR